jgi:hypothetical protein
MVLSLVCPFADTLSLLHRGERQGSHPGHSTTVRRWYPLASSFPSSVSNIKHAPCRDQTLEQSISLLVLYWTPYQKPGNHFVSISSSSICSLQPRSLLFDVWKIPSRPLDHFLLVLSHFLLVTDPCWARPQIYISQEQTGQLVRYLSLLTAVTAPSPGRCTCAHPSTWTLTGLVSIVALPRMTDYAPRSSPDYNSFFPNPQLAMSHYSNGNGLSYLYGNGQVQYQTVNGPCPAYSTAYAPAHDTPTSSVYMSNGSGLPVQYSVPSSRVPTLPSQSRALPHSSYYATSSPSHRSAGHHPRLVPPRDLSHMDGTECQDSPNEDTMLSEPILPPLEGYPDVHEFDELMKR